jgi:hypothetical protein
MVEYAVLAWKSESRSTIDVEKLVQLLAEGRGKVFHHST